MACAGKCQVQIYDAVIGEITIVKLVTKPPTECADSVEVQDYELAPLAQKVSGCEDKDCHCEPVEEKLKWTDWLGYWAKDVKITRHRLDSQGNDLTCEYVVNAYYYLSSAVADGVCMPGALGRYYHNPRPKWWKREVRKRIKEKE